MSSRLRPTIRTRLTLLYGGLFLIAGLVLLTVTYVLVRHNLENQPIAQLAVGAVDQAGVATNQDGAAFASAAQNQFAQEQERLRADTLSSLLRQGAVALGLVAVVAVAFGYLTAERVLRPLQRITETAHRVSSGSLAFGGGPAERINLDGPSDEIKDLADTFDEMLERLAGAFDSQRRFTANASHELRTPLAINRTLVEVALRRRDASEDARRLGEALLIVNARHERLINGLLTLAQGENNVVSRAAVDLRDVATHVLAQCEREAGEAAVAVRADLGAAPTTGDPVLIERLVQNLVENAIRHNSAGWLGVTTRRAPTGGAEVVVANTGPVVPPYDIDALFEPFRRLGTDRVTSDRGAGLGLSIVRAVARSHGGEVHAVPRDGGGLVVTVRLPPPRG